MDTDNFNNITQVFSETTIRYILNEIPPYLGLVVLQADDEGILQKWYGPTDKYFDQKPIAGQPIDSFAPFLYGMVPPLINPMVIPHLRINEKHYVELHILMDEESRIWIFFIDQTREVEIIHPIIQLYNEEKLSKINDQKESTAKGALTALYLLDYMSFERNKSGMYRLLGAIPSWFEKINAKLFFDGKKVLLTETFPYLEVFQIEAEEVWSNSDDGKLVSGLWEESINRYEKMYLQALALRHEDRNYLLIKPVNQDSGIEKDFIQKARDQRLTLDQLASTERKLKQLLSFKDQFVSIVSHDLRSPIGAVIGLSNLLLDDENLRRKLDAGQLELLGDIKAEMVRLLDYNDKLYQWSNLELGNFKVVKEKVQAHELSNFVRKMQGDKLKQKKISFSHHIDETFLIEGDETLLGQALNNLVGNSVKFTPEGGAISILFRNEDERMWIEVCDSGIGMDEETCHRLFSGFTRKTTMGTFGERGTGLGLGIVKKIMDAHGFTIRVSSQPGKGSTFTIDLNKS